MPNLTDDSQNAALTDLCRRWRRIVSGKSAIESRILWKIASVLLLDLYRLAATDALTHPRKPRSASSRQFAIRVRFDLRAFSYRSALMVRHERFWSGIPDFINADLAGFYFLPQPAIAVLTAACSESTGETPKTVLMTICPLSSTNRKA